MHTKKHNKKGNKLTKQSKQSKQLKQTKIFGGGLSEEIEEKPSYMKHTLIMLGISTCYIVLKLTKG
jgi:hypothetical protein